MKLYLDDNRASAALAAMLRKAGHEVVVPKDVGLAGASDPRHLRHATKQGFVLLTADQVDFTDLHDLILTAGGTHPGILFVLFENDVKRDMKANQIVAAIGKLEMSGLNPSSQIAILNHWR